jgi:hypothetical protein
MADPPVSRCTVDTELRRDDVGGALDAIAEHGHLLRVLPDRRTRLATIRLLHQRGLITWNRPTGCYELTAAGHDALARARRPASDIAKRAATG